MYQMNEINSKYLHSHQDADQNNFRNDSYPKLVLKENSGLPRLAHRDL